MLSPEVRAASLAALSSERAGHQRLDTLVHIAEPLFQPHRELAIGGEAEMPGLDDAGVHRPDRDLVQPLPFDGQELIRHLFAAPPDAVIEPGPRILRADGFQPVQIPNGPLQPDRRRMLRPDAGELAVDAFISEYRDIAAAFVEQRHVHVRRVAPQAEQGHLSAGKPCDGLTPTLFVHGVAGDGHGAIPATARRFRSPPPAPAADRCRP